MFLFLPSKHKKIKAIPMTPTRPFLAHSHQRYGERERDRQEREIVVVLHLERERVTSSSPSAQPTPPLVLLPTSNDMQSNGSDHFFFFKIIYEKDCAL